ncbi:MAG: hypothetical protein VYA55_08035 [Pseudomonadota bacterium]|nr:hypothetical protein [Pseudomonadota bacterium]
MKSIFKGLATLLVAFCVWVVMLAFLVGALKSDWLAPYLKHIKFPTSAAELGDSLNIFVGLISTFTVLVAVYAVILQSRSLKHTVAAQREQEQALLQQMQRQEIMLQISSYTARIQILASDREWYQHLIDRYREIRELERDETKRQEAHDKMTRCQNVNKEIKDKMNELSAALDKLTQRLEVGST